MSKGFFITGTDTGVGKTRIACDLLGSLKSQGYQTAALKPLASGAILTKAGLRHEDALLLQQACTVALPYEQVNPIVFAEPIAPHIGALQNNIQLTAAGIFKLCQPVLKSGADYIVVEGAGGLQVPLNQQETIVDLVKLLEFPLIVVVAIRLGCLNHAILTQQSIRQTGLEVAGWIANIVDENILYAKEQIDYLEQRLDFPLMKIMPWKLFN